MAAPLATALAIVGGAPITATGLTVFAQGAPVALVGDVVLPHGIPPHDSSIILTGSPTVFAMGRPIASAISLTSCGDPVIPTQFTVLG